MLYAVRHEYALTPIDVLARRTRLCFLNVQAALEALPRVVDIMGAELHWSRAEKARQIKSAVAFLASMGLPPGSVPLPVAPPHGLLEHAEMALWGAGEILAGGLGMRFAGVPNVPVYSRSKFERGEMAALKNAFDRHAAQTQEGAGRIPKAELMAVLKEVPGYEEMSAKDCEYVLEEAGFKRRVDVDFDEFLEVRIVSHRQHSLLTDAADLREPEGGVVCACSVQEA